MLAQRLPEHIAPFKNARQGVSLQGAISLEGMVRLAPMLANPQSEVSVTLNFGVDEQGVSYMRGQVQGEVDVVCQRCMEPVRVQLDVDVSVGFVLSDDQARNMPEGYEPYTLAGEKAVLADLIEDELILALPIVAMHPDQSCQPWFDQNQEAAKDDAVAEKKENPFAVLSNLKRH